MLPWIFKSYNTLFVHYYIGKGKYLLQKWLGLVSHHCDDSIEMTAELVVKEIKDSEHWA